MILKTLPDELLPGPAEQYSGRSRVLLFRLAASGQLPVRVVGGRLFFERTALDAVKRARRRSKRPNAVVREADGNEYESTSGHGRVG